MSEINGKKEELIKICELIYQKGFVAATDGNLSIKSGDKILFTPSGSCKGFLKAEDLIITDIKGNLIEGNGKVTTEISMHLAVYEERPDLNAVVHAHPPVTVALTYAGIRLSECLLPEVIVSLGDVPTVPYRLTGTKELADAIRPYIMEYDAVILDKHGVVSAGKDISDAYYKLEKIEHNAHVLYMAKQLGKVYPLEEEQKKELISLRNRIKSKEY